jgi:hypothetical protein
MAENNPPAEQPADADNSFWGGGVALIVVVGAIWFFSKDKSDKPVTPTARPSLTTPAVPIAGPSTAPPKPVAATPAPAMSIARLAVSGRDGTPELIQFANGLTDNERLALGLNVLLTGVDTYAARIQITNTGNVPVRVYPENLSIHFGGDSVGVTSISHPRFLQRGVLQPGFTTDGLVLYRARVDVGAAVRFVGGGLSYNDTTIQVTYN